MMSSIRFGTTRFLLGALASIVSVAGLVGCTGAGGVVATAPPWWEPHLTVDHDLKTLGLREIRLTRSRSESGFLRVAGEYVNRSDAKLSAIFRFTWLDASGQPVESILSSWQAVHTLPRTRATFAGIAPRGDIQEFRVELMSAHRLKGRPPRRNPDR
jgi:uncharacterized protein YcfL